MTTSLPKSEILTHLRQIDEYEFEQLIADIWENRGWQTKVTAGSNDRGVDVVATRNNPFFQKHLIQAKRYAEDNAVSSTEIQQYASLKQQEPNVDAVIVVTTSHFSQPAQNIASDLNIKMIDGNRLYEVIDKYGGSEVIQEYFVIPSESDKSEENKSSMESSPRSQRNRSPSTRPDSNSNQRPDVGVDTYEREVGVRTSEYLREKCPVCGRENTIQEVQQSDKKDQFLCNSCGTEWVIKTEEITYEDYPEYSGVIGYLKFLLLESAGPEVKLEVVKSKKRGEEYSLEK